MGPEWLNVPPQVRLALVNPSHEVMKLLACAFSVCHAIKFQHPEEILHSQAESDPHPMAQCILKLAASHLEDLRLFSSVLFNSGCD